MEVHVVSATAQRFNGQTYYLCGDYFQRKGRRLHRAVWEYHNGEIPTRKKGAERSMHKGSKRSRMQVARIG